MDKDFTAEKFLKGLQNFDKVCGSCKYFNSEKDQCRIRQIGVNSKTPKCSKWRYFT